MIRMTGRRRLATVPATLLAVVLTLAGAGAPAATQSAAPAPASSAADAERDALRAEVERVKVVGPAQIVLRDQARLALPAARLWIPQPAAAKIMTAMGNKPDDRLLGLVYPTGDDDDWIVVAEYEPAGYVKDDDARDWNADELLQSLKDGTASANEARRAKGFPELEVTGWAEKPAYDAATHRLVWAANARDKGDASGPAVVNYNTYALGRDGFVSLNLLTDSAHLEADKVQARALLGQLSFVDGKRYADFDSKTDRIAEYGLAALVAGVAAKKLGLLAIIGVALLKFWKLGLVAVFGAGALWPRLRARFGKQPVLPAPADAAPRVSPEPPVPPQPPP